MEEEVEVEEEEEEEQEEEEEKEEEKEEEDYHGPRLCLVAFCLKPASSLAKSHKLLLSRCQLHIHLAAKTFFRLTSKQVNVSAHSL